MHYYRHLIYINEIQLYLDTGNEITFRIDGKEINEILP